MESRHSMKKNVILCIDVAMQFSLCHRRAATTSVRMDIIWKILLYSLGMTNDFIRFSSSSFASNYGITEQSFRIFDMLYSTFVFPTVLISCISFHYYTLRIIYWIYFLCHSNLQLNFFNITARYNILSSSLLRCKKIVFNSSINK